MPAKLPFFILAIVSATPFFPSDIGLTWQPGRHLLVL
jgi:hypothetical protein